MGVEFDRLMSDSLTPTTPEICLRWAGSKIRANIETVRVVTSHIMLTERRGRRGDREVLRNEPTLLKVEAEPVTAVRIALLEGGCVGVVERGQLHRDRLAVRLTTKTAGVVAWQPSTGAPAQVCVLTCLAIASARSLRFCSLGLEPPCVGRTPSTESDLSPGLSTPCGRLVILDRADLEVVARCRPSARKKRTRTRSGRSPPDPPRSPRSASRPAGCSRRARARPG